MTRQRITVRIDALTVEGGRLSPRALERAIARALADRLSAAEAPLTPPSAALDKVEARARPAPRETGPEAAIARAVAGAAQGVLKP